MQVKSSYIDVMYALHLQKLRDQQLKLAENIHKAVYTQFGTGMANGMDLTKAELQVAEAQNDIDDSRRTLHLARYSLFNNMGLDPEKQTYSIEFCRHPCKVKTSRFPRFRPWQYSKNNHVPGSSP
jgi:cobalt-zinc-cadmium efflux system outer membrane protein